MIKKVISGFQSGADLGGVLAAMVAGLNVGGYAPRRFRDEFGDRPYYEQIFNAKQIDETKLDRDIPARTRRNVIVSDATIVFIGKESPGSQLTINTAKKSHKPCFPAALGLIVGSNDPILRQKFKEGVHKWLKNTNPEILNVSGNRESVCPGITYCVFTLMLEILMEQKEVQNNGDV